MLYEVITDNKAEFHHPFICQEVTMSYNAPTEFDGVTAVCKANIYFDGKVVSHALTLADGSRKTLGLIYPGSYRFSYNFV